MKTLTIENIIFRSDGFYKSADDTDWLARWWFDNDILYYQLPNFPSYQWRNATPDRDKRIVQRQNELKYLLTKENRIMKTLKDYFKKHQEIFLTLGVLLLIDYVVFNGALSGKLKDLVEKLIGNVSKKIEALGEGEKDEKLVG